MSEDKLRRQLYDSVANRAHIYHLLFDQLRSELGAEKAAELMGRAIYQRGAQIGARYESFAPRDLEVLKRAFLANVSDDGAMFAPEVVRCDAESLDIKLHRCPLKEAWLDAGLAQDGQGVEELAAGLTQPDHQARLGRDFRMQRLEVLQEPERVRVVRTRTRFLVETRHRFEIVVHHIGRRGVENAQRAIQAAAEIRRQDFDARFRRQLARLANAFHEVSGATISQIVTVHAGDHHVLELQRGNRASHYSR